MYVGDLIAKIRRRTGALRYSKGTDGYATEGITQETICDFLNDAKDYIQIAIVNTDSTICDEDSIIAVVANQEEYEISDRLVFGNKIRNMQYSNTSQLRDYRDLPQLRDEERRSSTSSSPIGYIRRGKKFSPVPIIDRTGGSFRVEYPRVWDDLQVAIGVISAKTSTTITLNPAETVYYDSVAVNLLNSSSKLCSISTAGVVKDYNISVTSAVSSTGVITIPSQTLNCAVGDLIVIGEYASSHTNHLPTPLVEQYIRVEAQMRVFDQRTSIDAIRETSFLKRIYDAIVEGYENEIMDETDIPLSDPFAMS